MMSEVGFARKVPSKFPYFPGTKPSIQTSQILASTGIPALDSLLHGGLPVGNLLLLEEDKFGNYSNILTKYFIAEGVVNQCGLLVGSMDKNPQDILESLPQQCRNDADGNSSQKTGQMKIAWRYENVPQVNSEIGLRGTKEYYFDLSKRMDRSLLDSCEMTTFSLQDLHSPNGDVAEDCLSILRHLIQCQLAQERYRPDIESGQGTKKNILRITLQTLGSPLWGTQPGCEAKLTSFLYWLRQMARQTFCVVLITIPGHLFDQQLLMRCRHLADCVIQLKAFADTDKEPHPAFKDFHGLLEIVKLPCTNRLCSYVPESFDLVFKLKRKSFAIENFHLPPELPGTEQREQDDVFGCSSALKTAGLDF